MKILLAACYTTIIIATIILLLTGCATATSVAGAVGLTQMSGDWCERHPKAGESRCWGRPEQSWDQANLKRHDADCPTAIYIAPNGVLEQCF